MYINYIFDPRLHSQKDCGRPGGHDTTRIHFGRSVCLPREFDFTDPTADDGGGAMNFSCNLVLTALFLVPSPPSQIDGWKGYEAASTNERSIKFLSGSEGVTTCECLSIFRFGGRRPNTNLYKGRKAVLYSPVIYISQNKGCTEMGTKADLFC